MPAVRSGSLFHGLIQPGPAQRLFTVPAEHTVLVKHLLLLNFHSSAVVIEAWVGSTPANMDYTGAWDVGASRTLNSDTWLALSAGYVFGLRTSGASVCRCLVSGAVLPGSIDPLPGTKPA